MNLLKKYQMMLGKRLDKKKIDWKRYNYLMGILYKWQHTQDAIDIQNKRNKNKNNTIQK
jgi:hypothetical protein